MASDPHLLASGAFETVRLPDGREAPLPRLPLAMGLNRSDGEVALPVPGADNATALGRPA